MGSLRDDRETQRSLLIKKGSWNVLWDLKARVRII